MSWTLLTETDLKTQLAN